MPAFPKPSNSCHLGDNYEGSVNAFYKNEFGILNEGPLVNQTVLIKALIISDQHFIPNRVLDGQRIGLG